MIKRTSRAFTLIELLVVVLIIAILAAVALPQYQKAVLKSRLAQWDVMFDAGKKALDLYLLENGFPERGNVNLTDGNHVIEMPGNCVGNWCYTSAGRMRVTCFVSPSECNIMIQGRYGYKAGEGMFENTALGDDSPSLEYVRYETGDSYMRVVGGKAGCLWVAERYPDIPVISAKITGCKDTYGVTLPNPEYTE